MGFYSELSAHVKRALPPPIVSVIEFILRIKRKQPFYVLTMEPTYDEDGLFTNHNCDFMHEPLFKEAYALGFATGSPNSWHLHWRAYTACWLAGRANNIEGYFLNVALTKV